MTLSETIIYHRKQRGWSQEDLAGRLGVSRQSVSKWESAASQPELDKVILLAQVFDITTDALLKGTDAAPTPAPPPEPSLRRVTLQEGQDYAALTARIAGRFALAVAACVFSPTPLILLAGFSQFRDAVSEGLAAGAGVAILLLIVAVAVFIAYSMHLSQYSYISDDPFQAAPELLQWASAEKARLTPAFTRCLVIGVTLCILGVVPLILLACLSADPLHLVLGVVLLLWLIAVAVFLFVRAGMRYGCCTQLLQQGDYSPEQKRFHSRVGGVYWCVVTAAYLAVSFLTNRWDRTWILFACAGVLYGGLCALAQHKAK